MARYFVPGMGYVSDQDVEIPQYGSIGLPSGESVSWGPEGIRRLPEYSLTYQFPATEDQSGSLFQWEPGAPMPAMSYSPTSYIPKLLELADKADAGQLNDLERWEWEDMRAQALAIPTRDLSRLTSTAQGGVWTGIPEGADEAWTLTNFSPDVGAILLGLRDKMRAGTASAQERDVFENVARAANYQHWVASVPQPSDAFNPISNEFFTALGFLGAAAGGAAAYGAFAPLAGAGAGAGAGSAAAAAGAAPSILGIPTSTLGTLGAIGSYGGMGANILGGITQQPWLQKLGLALGVGGGLAGGLAGLGNVFSTGVNTVGDVARLAGSAGKITGALGRASGVQPLQQAGRYLGLGSQVGQLGGGVAGLLGAAQGVQAGATGEVTRGLGDAATRGGDMAEWYDLYPNDMTAAPYDDWSWNAGLTDFTGWGDPYGPGSSGDTGFSGEGSGGWLGGLGSALGGIGGLLAKNPGLVGAGVSALGSLGSGAIGANAASDAARLQAAALNRGIDLQTAQWLQQQANQAPWVRAGQQALPQLQQLAGQGQPTLQQVAPYRDQPSPFPGITPGWQASLYAGYTPTSVPGAADYRYTPGQGPRAGDYRYTPGAIPDPNALRYTPGGVPRAADSRYTPGAVPTLSGAALLANDPGVAFRLQEGQRALEASAAASGGALSGPALAALQRQGQELSSQEYAQAWQRAAQQAQMREGWQQYATQQGFGQAMSEAQLREQLAQQAVQMGWGQQMGAAQLREQVNQQAAQQGWSQAQAEAAFREQLAQQAGAQNWGQALQEAQARAQQQQFGWQANVQAQQLGQREAQSYEQQIYDRLLQQNELLYGRAWQQREAENQRLMEAYNAQRLGQSTGWNQWASLAGLGQTSLGQLGQFGAQYGQQMGNLYGQLGTAQALGPLGQAQGWNTALGGLTNNATAYLRGLNA